MLYALHMIDKPGEKGVRKRGQVSQYYIQVSR